MKVGYSDCIPFFSVIGDGEQIFCFDREGKIVVFDGYEMHDVEGDFESFLLGQIAELEERKDKKVEKLKIELADKNSDIIASAIR